MSASPCSACSRWPCALAPGAALPVGAGELMLHVAIDTVVLGWLLFLTGGATNPFAALLLLPITSSPRR